MPSQLTWLSIISCCLSLSCSGPGGGQRGDPEKPPAGPPLAQREQAAASALNALRKAQFKECQALSGQLLEKDAQNPYAHLAAAISQYRQTMHDMVTDILTMAMQAYTTASINQRFIQFAAEKALKDMQQVSKHLEAADLFPGLGLDLCLACWEVDWNRSGKVDDRDRMILQIEQDAHGQQIPEGDPRRKPRFRFDHGDVAWARAFLSFQQAALQLVLAYDWSTANEAIQAALRQRKLIVLTIKLQAPERVSRARKLILAGLEQADIARRRYLAEEDDEREWLPSPKQKNHPLPLPVDEVLYQTWELVTDDIRRLVGGEEGLNIEQLAQLGDHQWKNPPRGYLDLGGLLANPKDIVVDLQLLDKLEDNRDGANRPEVLLKQVFGQHYRDQMKPSQLIKRLDRMKQEVTQGKESMERKLRYLLWLN